MKQGGRQRIKEEKGTYWTGEKRKGKETGGGEGKETKMKDGRLVLSIVVVRSLFPRLQGCPNDL